MTIEELEKISKDNMGMCFKSIGKNDNRMAKIYLDYANIAALKAILKNVVYPKPSEIEPVPEDECMWLEFGCQNCTVLHCQYNGEE
jgi:hypothetical protein